MSIDLQDELDDLEAASNAAAVAAAVAPLNATIAAKTATITAQAATIADLQAQLDNIPPPEVPTLHNTGFRGGLTAAGASALTGAANTTLENKQITYPTSFGGANVTLKNDRVYSAVAPALGTLDGSAATGFEMINTTIVGNYKGAGTFIGCTIGALELTAVSTVTDCYIPGGITGAGKAASLPNITNTTVTVLP